jgi:hypothetical protein
MSQTIRKKVWARAFQEARHATRIETNERLLVGIILAVVTGGLIWWVDPDGAKVGWFARFVPAIAFIIVFLFVFGWKLLSVPALMIADAAAEAERLKTELQAAHDRIAYTLRLSAEVDNVETLAPGELEWRLYVTNSQTFPFGMDASLSRN